MPTGRKSYSGKKMKKKKGSSGKHMCRGKKGKVGKR